MSIVKHKRGSAPEVSARREAELKALADKPDREIDYSDIPTTEDDRWAGAVRENSIDRSKLRHQYALTPT